MPTQTCTVRSWCHDCSKLFLSTLLTRGQCAHTNADIHTGTRTDAVFFTSLYVLYAQRPVDSLAQTSCVSA